MLLSYLKETGRITEKGIKRIKQLTLPVGLFSFLIGSLLGRFGPDTGAIAFLSGMFTGISIVLNLAAVYYYTKYRRV